MKMKYEEKLNQALIKAVEKGWLDEEDLDDWQAEFDCIGSHDTACSLYNCEECPLESICIEWIDEEGEDDVQMYEDQSCQDGACEAAPLGCADSRYCPGKPSRR